MPSLRAATIRILAMAVVAASLGIVTTDDAEARKRHGSRNAAAKQAPRATNAAVSNAGSQQIANEQTVSQASEPKQPRKDSGDAHLDYAVGGGPRKDSGDANLDYVIKKDAPNKDSGDAHLDY